MYREWTRFVNRNAVQWSIVDLATKVIVECAFEESRIGAVNNIKHDLERLLTLVEKSIDTYGSNDHLDRP